MSTDSTRPHLDEFFREVCATVLGKDPTGEEVAAFVFGMYAEKSRQRLKREGGDDSDPAAIRSGAVRAGGAAHAARAAQGEPHWM